MFPAASSVPRTAWYIVSPQNLLENESLAHLQYPPSHWYLCRAVTLHACVCIFKQRTNCYPASPVTSQRGVHLNCVCKGAAMILVWGGEDCRGNENPPRTIISRMGSLLKGPERPVAPSVVPRVTPSLQITSFAKYSNAVLKFLALKEQCFPRRPHTL